MQGTARSRDVHCHCGAGNRTVGKSWKILQPPYVNPSPHEYISTMHRYRLILQHGGNWHYVLQCNTVSILNFEGGLILVISVVLVDYENKLTAAIEQL